MLKDDMKIMFSICMRLLLTVPKGLSICILEVQISFIHNGLQGQMLALLSRI
jgi:hypothetical protein